MESFTLHPEPLTRRDLFGIAAAANFHIQSTPQPVDKTDFERLNAKEADGEGVDIELSPCGVVRVIHVQSVVSEGKPQRGKDGSLWRSMRCTGCIAYAKDGSAYWCDTPGVWERL